MSKTMSDIRALHPCYDPARYAPEDWTGTALDVLKAEQVSAKDRLWLVCHESWIDDRTLRLFAVWCARRALAMIDDPHPDSVAACDVAERYANGQASEKELNFAQIAALAVTRIVAGDTNDDIRTAAWTAAWAIAWTAAWAARRASVRIDTGNVITTQADQIAHLISMLTTT